MHGLETLLKREKREIEGSYTCQSEESTVIGRFTGEEGFSS